MDQNALACHMKTTQERQIPRKGARLAIHCPPSTRNDYVLSEANLETTEKTVINLAKKYILSQ